MVFNGLDKIANDKPFFNGAGNAATIGIVSGVFTFGIGEIAGQIGNVYLRAGFQIAAHGLYNGISSELQGGKFIHGFAAGAYGSLGASLSKDILKVGTVGQIFAVGVSGGIGSAVTGGNFYRGFAQGIIVSAFNHALHNAMEEYLLGKVLEQNNIKPNEKADFGMESVDKIREIEMFKKMESKGKNPSYQVLPSKPGLKNTAGHYNDMTHTLELYSKAFRTNLYLAITIGHELQHAIHYNNYFKVWLDHRKGFLRTDALNYSEYLSYSWEYKWSGNYSGNTFSQMTIYQSKSAMLISIFGNY